MRKASMLIPSFPRSHGPPRAKKKRTAPATATARRAIRACSAFGRAPARARNTGAMPTGSTTTKRVRKARRASSVIGRPRRRRGRRAITATPPARAGREGRMSKPSRTGSRRGSASGRTAVIAAITSRSSDERRQHPVEVGDVRPGPGQQAVDGRAQDERREPGEGRRLRDREAEDERGHDPGRDVALELLDEGEDAALQEGRRGEDRGEREGEDRRHAAHGHELGLAGLLPEEAPVEVHGEERRGRVEDRGEGADDGAGEGGEDEARGARPAPARG